MFIKSKLFRVISVFSLIFFISVGALADTIRFKDGRIIKGRIISFDGGKFTVLIADGQRERRLDFRADEVESIVFDAGLNIAQNNQTSSVNTTREGDSTIITVGQSDDDTQPVEVDDIPFENDVPENNSNSERAVPITIRTPVMADNTANGWTNSGWVVKKGQRIKITGSGRVSLGNGRYAQPGGISTLPDTGKLIQDKPTGGLIAVIGADNNDFIFVGNSLEFIAQRDGDLFLGVNEGNLNDNSGSFDVVIEIDPTTGN